MIYRHTSVMTEEVLGCLDPKRGKIYVDCTLGGAGHALAVLGRILPEGRLIGIDQDPDAIRNAETVLAPYGENVRLFHDNFVNLPEIAGRLGLSGFDGILLDLGLSLHHLEGSGRGFSFKREEPLDMRMNPAAETTAAFLVNTLQEGELAGIFRDFGEERRARRIARRIVFERKREPIRTTRRLAGIVASAMPRGAARQKIDPATRVFMALRIAVNRELEILERFMLNAVDLLNPLGRLCVLSFHSLEDRIVKHRFKALEKGCICPPEMPRCACGRKSAVRILYRKALRPSEAEIAGNPPARSARLRGVEKL